MENEPCMFCGKPVSTKGEGLSGVRVGGKFICDECLEEMKNALEKV